MNSARTAVLALITCAGVAIPATRVHAEDPLLCGLLAPCDEEGGDDGGADDTQPAPVDDGTEIDLDLGLGLEMDVDIQPFPSSETLLTADTDVDHTTLQLAAADHTLELGSQAALDTGASIGHDGIVVTGNGSANAQADATTWRQLVGLEAANQFCGVQIVIAAESSATCQPNASLGRASSNDGLIAVAESIDLCGAHVVLAGSATTDCGEPPTSGSSTSESSPTGSPAAGSSWTLADAAVTGTLCGVSVAVAGRSDTMCAGTAQETPVPSADPDRSDPGTLGTGAGEGAGSSPAAGGQSAQTPNDEGNSGTAAGESRGSLPLTGMSVLLFLALAAAVVATGLVAVRSSRVRVGPQS